MIKNWKDNGITKRVFTLDHEKRIVSEDERAGPSTVP